MKRRIQSGDIFYDPMIFSMIGGFKCVSDTGVRRKKYFRGQTSENVFREANAQKPKTNLKNPQNVGPRGTVFYAPGGEAFMPMGANFHAHLGNLLRPWGKAFTPLI